MRNKIDSFEDGGIIVCQDVMNSATMKYNNIVSVHTVHDDIVAMMAKSHTNKSHTNKKYKQVDNDNDTDNNPSDKKYMKRDTP